jgi:hypothetical protein
MENAKHILVLIIGTVLATNLVQSAEQPQQSTLTNTRQASCLVKITCAPAVLPLGFETIDYLLHSSGVGGKAVRDVLGISTDQVPGDYCTIEYVQELTSNAASKSSTGSSSGPDGMYEYEYAMMMDMEAQRKEMPMGKTMPSTTSPGRVRSFPRTRKNPLVGRTITSTITSPSEEQTYLFSLNIQLPEEVKPEAEKLMDALLQNLRSVLAGAFDEHLQRLRDQLKLADEETQRAEHELSTRQEELNKISDSRILDRNLILNNISNLRSDIQKIEMEEASNRITVDAMMKQIAETKDKMMEEINKDGVGKDLAELVVLHEKNLRNVEKLSESGRASVAEVTDAREKLARARIELAQRRDQLSKSAGGNLIDSLNSQLADYSIKAAQNQAKLSNLKQQLNEAEELLGKTDDYELLSLKIDIAKQNLQEAILWRDEISRKIRIIQPPLVSVIGGD